MKKLEAKDFVKINGGCFCYCFANPYNYSMPVTLFVKETVDSTICEAVCEQSKDLPYFGYYQCQNEKNRLFGEEYIDYPQHVLDQLAYENGGWQANYPELFSSDLK